MDVGLRVAFIGQKGLPARWGGVEAHVEAVATRLAARGHDVTAYVRRWYGAAGGTLGGVRLRAVPTAGSGPVDATIHSGLSAIDALRRGFDIVHFQALGPSLFCWLPHLSGTASVVTIHALDYGQQKWGGVARGALRLGERLALSAADRVLVVSQTLRHHYAERGYDVAHLGNGIDPAADTAPDLIVSRLGLRGDDYLLFVGRWIPDKRVIELIEGFGALAPSGLSLVVAGDDPSRGAYGRAVRRVAEVTPGVVLPGMVDGRLKDELLSSACGFVTPSDHEGLPIALLEAMSHGRACLASDITPHREALAETGLVRPLSNRAEMVAGLRELVGLSDDRRRRLGTAARVRASSEYSWEDVIDRLEGIYQGVLGPLAARGSRR